MSLNSNVATNLSQLLGELGCSLDPELPKTPEALRAEEHLKEFMTQAWPVMEPGTPYIHGWHIDAICEHLEAVVRGEIRDLLINMPPRHCKTLLVSVAFPCWLWTRQPSAKFLFASYAQQLSIRDSVACRRLLMSQWYQRNWAQSFSLTADQNVKQRFENDKRGYRLATSVGGQLTGEGGDYIIADDPHNVKDAESDAVRTGTLEWWDKAMSTRLNNPKTGHKIIVMQRVHQDDLAGHVVEQGGYYHLCLPARYEGQKTHWIIGWQDPRKKEGELLWPERFGEPEVQKLERALGSYAAAAQLQQRPTPAEGGIFKKSWCRTYSDRPQFIRVVESWDTATSDQELAAFSVGTVWGETATGDFYLIHVERGRYTFPKLKATVRVLHTKFNGCAVLVEDKSSGRQVCQELGRGKRIPILPVKVGKQDKIARALTVSPLVESGHVYLPENAPWLAAYMEEMLNFPNSKYKDQVDSTTQALNYLRGGSATSLMDLR